MRTMHLFAGVGGGLLADLILGHTPIIAVEWDKYACQVLRERAADGWFPDLSVWEGDVRLFDPSEYAGKVDCIHAGLHCQPYSITGLRAGLDDPRGGDMWNETLRIIQAIRPGEIRLENVPGFIDAGLPAVVADLAALGYDAEWMCLSATDIGANHVRERWWGLAHSNSAQRKRNGGPVGVSKEYSNAWSQGWWRNTSRVQRVANGVPNRIHRLKGLGNAQVPLQAATAWRLLGGE